MSQDNELSNIIRYLRHMEDYSREPSYEEWSDVHRRIVQLPRTDRRQLYKNKEYVPLGEVLDWQQTCPPDKRITDVGSNSEEEIRIAFEINKRVAIWKGEAEIIECDALLISPVVVLWDKDDAFKRYARKNGRFDITRVCHYPANSLYKLHLLDIDEGNIIEFLTIATQSGYRSLVIDLRLLRYSERLLTIIPGVKRWLEQNYNLVDKIIFCAEGNAMYHHLTERMPTHFPVYVANIPESKLPAEILRMDSRSIEIFKKALSDGKHVEHNIRVMLVGHSGVGKTTFLKGLLGQKVDIDKRESTDGIEVPVHRCQWTLSEEGKLPAEIRSKGSRAIQIYKKALLDGKHAVQNIRVMLVGHSGVGKTTLLKRLLDQDVDIKKIESTEGIEVHVHRCKIDIDSGQWHCQDKAPPRPNAALLSAILPLLTVTPQEPILQPVQDTSPEFDTSLITNDEVIHGRQQIVTGVDVTISSEPESDKSENSSEADVHASTIHDTSLSQARATLGHVTPYDVKLNVDKRCEVRPQASSSKSDDTKVKLQFKELMKTYESSKSLSGSNFANVSFWDFAGQYIFYNTHQVFLSHRTVYLLVTRLKHIVDEAGPRRQDGDTKPYDTIRFWVDSIHFFCGKENHDPRVPPVILVATHVDKVDHAQKEILNHFQKVRDIFTNPIIAGHIVDDLEFAVDNSVKDPKLEELKRAILEIAKTQYYWQEEHPVRWLTLEKELFVKRDSGEKVLRLEDVKGINRMLPVPLSDTAELDLFLQFQSDLGNILYISEGDLKDYVLLNPQWVADAFKCIITAEHFLKGKSIMRIDWNDQKKTGKIKTEIIEAVWRDKKSEKFFEEREFLLLLMQQLNLIARPVETEQPHNHFFVPCLITTSPSCQPIKFKGDATSVLTLSVASRFFPMILFYKLIASCIQKYTIHKDHIYNGSALFEHDLHVFTVLYVDNAVKVRVNSLNEDNPDIMVCHSVLKFLIECMNKLQLSCIKTPSVAVFACCPEVDKNSVQGMYQLPEKIDHWQELSEKKFVCSNKKCPSHTVSMRDALKYWITGSKKNAADQIYKKALSKAWVQLIADMHSDELLDRIIEKDLLNETAIQDLQNERNPSKRNRAVLEKVSKFGPGKYEVFKECLTLIKQEHLVKILEDYETESAAQNEGDAGATP